MKAQEIRVSGELKTPLRFLSVVVLLLSAFSNRAEVWPVWFATHQPPSAQELGYNFQVFYSIAGLAVDSSGSAFFAAPASVYSNGVVISNTMIAKFDVNGTLRWSTFFTTQPGDSFAARKLAADNEGGCYVAGDSILAGNKRVISLQKYNREGQLLWAVNDSETNGRTRQLRGMSVGDTGRIFLSGAEFTGAGRWNFLVIAFDSAGQQLWRFSYDGPASSNDNAETILAASSGGCVAAGSSTGVNSQRDYLVIRFDELGNVIWTARYDNTPSATETLAAMAQDWVGNIYVTGTSAPTNSVSRCVTVKYDAAGNELWSAQYRSSGNASTYGVALTTDVNQNVLVTGKSWNNVVTVKYNSSGEQLWEASYNSGSGQPEFPVAITVDSEGRAYVAATLFRKPENYPRFVSDVPALLGYSADGQLFMQRRHSPCWVGSKEGARDLIMHQSGEFYLAASEGIIKYSFAPAPEPRIDAYRVGSRGVGLLMTGEPAHCYEILTSYSGNTNWTRITARMNSTGRVDFFWNSHVTAPWRFFRFRRLD